MVQRLLIICNLDDDADRVAPSHGGRPVCGRYGLCSAAAGSLFIVSAYRLTVVGS